MQNTTTKNPHRPAALELELFTNRFRAIAEEMGEMLQRTSLSTNVKERLDFSCALLDPQGQLVVNAPHIPVHLGALGLCVREVGAAIPMQPGDVIITNHPGFGGSHLPDVTVISPVHSSEEKLLGYVANRCHHAEIGGTRPGSMPPFASKLIEEGVIIPPMHLIKNGKPKWETMRHVLQAASFPSRSVNENIADLQAAVAANNRGAQMLINLAGKYGDEQVHYFMDRLQENAQLQVQKAFQKLGNGIFNATEFLDDGAKISVKITVENNHAVIDFSGSSPFQKSNFNATPAIVRSATIYVLRLLLNEPLPLNEGLMAPVEIVLPTCFLNPDFSGDATDLPAVVGGNVETSQRVVDTLIKALGIAACSQGTMNNLLFGNDKFGYYETVCGGAGAGADFHGADAVHTHMTNTRITDPEILEYRYPVRLDAFTIRNHSGGSGTFNGGNGVVRKLTFLEPLSVSVLTQHRKTAPFGVDGAASGKPGKQTIIRANGQTIALEPSDAVEVQAGDQLIIETPGGGGFGVSKQND